MSRLLTTLLGFKFIEDQNFKILSRSGTSDVDRHRANFSLVADLYNDVFRLQLSVTHSSYSDSIRTGPDTISYGFRVERIGFYVGASNENYLCIAQLLDQPMWFELDRDVEEKALLELRRVDRLIESSPKMRQVWQGDLWEVHGDFRDSI